MGSTTGGVSGCVGSTAGGVGFVGAPGVFGAADLDFLTLTVKVLLNFFFFLFLAFVVTLILAVPAFLAVTVILLPLAFTLATEALLDLAVNFFEALPDTFTVTLKALLIDFFPAGIVRVAFLLTLIDLTNFFDFLALALIVIIEAAKRTQRITLKIFVVFFH